MKTDFLYWIIMSLNYWMSWDLYFVFYFLFTFFIVLLFVEIFIFFILPYKLHYFLIIFLILLIYLINRGFLFKLFINFLKYLCINKFWNIFVIYYLSFSLEIIKQWLSLNKNTILIVVIKMFITRLDINYVIENISIATGNN